MNEDNKGVNEPQTSWQFHQDSSTPPPPAPAGQQAPPSVKPSSPSAQTPNAASVYPQAQQPQQDQQVAAAQAPTPAPASPPEVAWRAAEFIVHEKSAGWYAAFVLIAVAMTALVFFISHDVFSLATIVVVFILVGWMAVRHPRDVDYQIAPEGIIVNGRLHPYDTFKSFGVQDEGGISSLVFMPLKRFMLPLYAYYPPEDEDKILEALSRHLPYAPTVQSTLERAAHRLKF